MLSLQGPKASELFGGYGLSATTAETSRITIVNQCSRVRKPAFAVSIGPVREATTLLLSGRTCLWCGI